MDTIKDIMVKDVIIADGDYTLEVVEKIMGNKNIGHVCIVAGGRLLGVISDGDIKRRKSFLAGTEVSTLREESTLRIKAHQIMTRELITLTPESLAIEAVDLFLKHDIHIIPIVEKGNKLVGVVSTSDLLRLMKSMIEAE
jgi:acetoin utilization protein AcuB